MRRSIAAASVNYSIQEYANDIVYALAEACREAELPMPHIISESGRALTAHHALLLINVIDLEAQLPDVPRPIMWSAAATMAMGLLVELAQGVSGHGHCRFWFSPPDPMMAIGSSYWSAALMSISAGHSLQPVSWPPFAAFFSMMRSHPSPRIGIC